MRPVDALQIDYAADVARRTEDHAASGFYLSDSGRCPRMRVMKALHYPCAPRGAREAEIGLLGDVVAEWLWHRRIKPLWPDAQREVWLETPYGRARMDAVVESENLIIECKKTKPREIDYLPKREHILQLQAYMYFSPYKRGILLYGTVGLGFSELAFDVDYDPAEGRAVEEELRHLEALRKQGVLPSVPQGYSPMEFPCSWYDKEVRARVWCRYGQHCWKDWGLGGLRG